MTGGGLANYVVSGVDLNRDGIPDVLQSSVPTLAPNSWNVPMTSNLTSAPNFRRAQSADPPGWHTIAERRTFIPDVLPAGMAPVPAGMAGVSALRPLGSGPLESPYHNGASGMIWPGAPPPNYLGRI